MPLAVLGGSFPRAAKYRYSRMNSIVYPVHGGMEDWAYAASWDTQLRVKQGCVGSSKHQRLVSLVVLEEEEEEEAQTLLKLFGKRRTHVSDKKKKPQLVICCPLLRCGA